MLTEFAKSQIQSFWNWISEHRDDVDIQYLGENKMLLYIPFDYDMLNEFTNRYQYDCEEGGCTCTIQTNGLCVDLKTLEGGYGFSMQDLWNGRPNGIEDLLGVNIY